MLDFAEAVAFKYREYWKECSRQREGKGQGRKQVSV